MPTTVLQGMSPWQKLYGSVPDYSMLKVFGCNSFVDDIIITGNDPQFMTDLITQLSFAFEMKDLGPLKYFLG